MLKRERSDFMRYYIPAELARELNIPKTTMMYWIKKGFVKPDIVLPSGKKKFSEETVQKLKSNMQEKGRV